MTVVLFVLLGVVWVAAMVAYGFGVLAAVRAERESRPAPLESNDAREAVRARFERRER